MINRTLSRLATNARRSRLLNGVVAAEAEAAAAEAIRVAAIELIHRTSARSVTEWAEAVKLGGELIVFLETPPPRPTQVKVRTWMEEVQGGLQH